MIKLLFLTFCVGVSCLNGPALYQLTDPVDHGEGPTYDNRSGLLYFVDIFKGRVLAYNLENSELNSVCFHGDVTPVIPSKSDPNLLIIGLNRSVFSINWNGKGELGDVQELTTVSQQFPTSRFNDGKADEKGRLWFGTMGFESSEGVKPNEGVLYKIFKDNLNNPEPMVQPVNISNGLAWNKSNNKLYYIDTPTFQVKQFNYNNEEGSISNSTVVFDLKDHDNLIGFPDGMTIDKDDNLWIALYNGGAVIKVNPKKKKLLQTIAIPAQPVTSVAWGGPNYDILFVTTSRHALSAVDRKRQPAAGSLFAITNLGTHGLPAFNADIL